MYLAESGNLFYENTLTITCCSFECCSTAAYMRQDLIRGWCSGYLNRVPPFHSCSTPGGPRRSPTRPAFSRVLRVLRRRFEKAIFFVEFCRGGIWGEAATAMSCSRCTK